MAPPLRRFRVVVALALIVGCSSGRPLERAAPVAAAASSPSDALSPDPTTQPGGDVAASPVEPPAPEQSEPAARPRHSKVPFLPLPAKAAYPRPCPPPPLPPRPPRPPAPKPVPKVAEVAVPTPVAVAPRRPSLVAARGKGTWAVPFSGRRFDARALVTEAKAAGVDSIWVRTGGYRQGYYGDDVLRALLIPAHRAGLKVIAWDFPALSDPAVDAERARRALAFTIQGHRLDGFSPDIETSSEGVFATSRRVAYYLSVVRRAAGNRPVVTTVPRPTAKRLAGYPYRAVAAGSDALAPMVYWSCLEPGATVASAMDRLAQFGLPVHVIGQAYSMASEGGRHGLPTAAETWRFIDVAKRRGAIGVSLYQAATAGDAQNRALAAYPWRA